MAELLLKIGDGANYQDGDIVCAFTDNHIYTTHAQIICNPKNFSFNAEGLRDSGTLLEEYLQRVSQYKFERISKSEVKRTDLSDMSFEIFNNTPNEKGERVDVEAYVERRKRNPRHKLFGSTGSEVWYGGRNDFSKAVIDDVWTKIEEMTANRKVDHTDWPVTLTEKKHLLVVPTLSITDQQREEIVKPVVDETDPDNPVVVKKRRFKIDWVNTLNISTDTRNKILDPNIAVEKPRSIKYDITQVRTDKGTQVSWQR